MRGAPLGPQAWVGGLPPAKGPEPAVPGGSSCRGVLNICLPEDGGGTSMPVWSRPGPSPSGDPANSEVVLTRPPVLGGPSRLAPRHCCCNGGGG